MCSLFNVPDWMTVSYNSAEKRLDPQGNGMVPAGGRANFFCHNRKAFISPPSLVRFLYFSSEKRRFAEDSWGMWAEGIVFRGNCFVV